MLTLFTTPVVYLYFDRMHHWWMGVRNRRRLPDAPLGSEA
jgi:HAE1 family hydrophobic/amphiphilic exporter-1